MKTLVKVLILVLMCTFITSCAQGVYSRFSEQLMLASQERFVSVDDVNMLLGSPPQRCEPVENPKAGIGIKFDKESQIPTIIAVHPNSPARKAGLVRGEIIRQVNGETIMAKKDLANIPIIAGKEMLLVTSLKTVSVVPNIPNTEQCYWELQGGRVAQTGSYAYANRYGGSASSSGSAYERFFRATCRVADKYVVNCTANWQGK